MGLVRGGSRSETQSRVREYPSIEQSGRCVNRFVLSIVLVIQRFRQTQGRGRGRRSRVSDKFIIMVSTPVTTTPPIVLCPSQGRLGYMGSWRMRDSRGFPLRHPASIPKVDSHRVYVN